MPTFIQTLVNYLPQPGRRFDLFIAGLGPESRATNILEKYHPEVDSKLALLSSLAKDHAFDGNRQTFQAANFTECNTDTISTILGAAIPKVDIDTLQILIDISCISRPAMATTLSSLLSIRSVKNFDISFVYSLAIFTQPLLGAVPNEAIEPVHIDFSGWPSQQLAPTSLVIGLGYEPDKAEGAAEYLDPSEQWGFVPVSRVTEFLPEVEKNNERLIQRLQSNDRIVRYDVHDPEQTFGQLEIIVSDLIRKSNPILMPFGPKIFYAICLIQSLCHPEIGVWHVTSEAREASVDRRASGIELGFRTVISRTENSPVH